MPIKKRLALNEPFDGNPSSLRAYVQKHREALTPILFTGDSFFLYTKEGNDPFTGNIVHKTVKGSASLDPIWELARVSPAGGKVVYQGNVGDLHEIRVPVVERGGIVYQYEDRVLLKFIPQFGTSGSLKTAGGSTYVTGIRTQFSEVQATTYAVFVDSAGNVFR